MDVKILTPQESISYTEVDSLVFPSSDGDIGILKHHAAMIASIKKGLLKISKNDEKKLFQINDGIFEIKNDKVVIITESITESK